MKTTPVEKMSSIEMREYIKQLEIDTKRMNSILVHKGQIVASCGMEDAMYGLQKTLSCWNHAIDW